MTSRSSSSSKQRGFTLIELCLVVGLCGLAASISWPALKEFTQNLSIQASADSLADQLSSAREKAVVTGERQAVNVRPNAFLSVTHGAAAFLPDGSASPFEAHFGSPSRDRRIVQVKETGEIHVQEL